MAPPAGTGIVDTHVHLFADDEKAFPLAPDPPYRPRSTLAPTTLVRHMNAAGVAVAVAVQPEPYGTDHRYLHWCVQTAPDRLRAVGVVAVALEDPAGAVGRLRQEFGSALVGVRIHLHGSYPDPPAGWLEELGRAAHGHRIFVQILGDAGRSSTAAAHLAGSDIPIVVDHMAKVEEPGDRAILEELAAVPSVLMKVSELHGGAPPTPVRARATVGAAVLDVFGPFRVLLGSGHGGTWSSRQYRRVIDDYRAMVRELDPPGRSAVLGENAMALLG